MAAIDPELQRHRRTWRGFTWFIRLSLVTIIIVVICLALALL